MIRFNLSVANPFKYREFRSLFFQSWTITDHKILEVQVYRYAYNLFEFSVDISWRGSDHAGPNIELGLFGWNFSVSLPDSRHWDYENRC
jgi:hypothetical protein